MARATATAAASGATATRLLDAVNRHDLDELADCFAPAFVNETPAHPARSFTGRDQVKKNWAQIFGGVPDLQAEIVRQVAQDDMVWLEWEMRGTRRDGTRHLMRGVSIFGDVDGRFAWVRFYLEPVEQGGVDIDATVRQQVGQ